MQKNQYLDDKKIRLKWHCVTALAELEHTPLFKIDPFLGHTAAVVQIEVVENSTSTYLQATG